MCTVVARPERHDAQQQFSCTTEVDAEVICIIIVPRVSSRRQVVSSKKHDVVHHRGTLFCRNLCGVVLAVADKCWRADALLLPADAENAKEVALVLLAGRRGRREAKGVPGGAAGHASVWGLFCQGIDCSDLLRVYVCDISLTAWASFLL